MTLDPNYFQQWVGKSRQEHDLITAAPLRGMTALLDHDANALSNDTMLPPLWHWLFFLTPARQSELAEDGHPRRGDFLPPVPLPRRMWAGGRLEFHHPLHIGDEITRRSTIKSVDIKEGGSGQLAFVCVAHEISNANGLAIYEEHDIVYRDNPPKQPGAGLPAGKAAPEKQDYFRPYNADPVMLFRYSALTFNGHRIHYDRDYVTRVEGYPGLIVHGPLLATLLVELLRGQQPEAHLEKFSFRAQRPVFDGQPFNACGRKASAGKSDLWIRDHEGFLCMQASAEFS